MLLSFHSGDILGDNPGNVKFGVSGRTSCYEKTKQFLYLQNNGKYFTVLQTICKLGFDTDFCDIIYECGVRRSTEEVLP